MPVTSLLRPAAQKPVGYDSMLGVRRHLPGCVLSKRYQSSRRALLDGRAHQIHGLLQMDIPIVIAGDDTAVFKVGLRQPHLSGQWRPRGQPRRAEPPPHRRGPLGMLTRLAPTLRGEAEASSRSETDTLAVRG